MPLYRLKRHVIYRPGCQDTEEVWGIDRRPVGLPVVCAPRDTDRDDPLRARDDCCGSWLLQTADGRYVSWHRFFEWASEAEAAGYEIVSGFKNLSPFTVVVLRGP